MLCARGIFPAQSCRNKVSVRAGGICRREDLNVGIGRVVRAAINEVAVI